MCINRQTLLIFYIFYYTFVFLVSVPLWQCYKVLPRSVWRREAGCPYLAGRPGGGSGGAGSLCRVLPPPGQHWSSPPRCLQLPWLSPSVLTGNDSRGRSAFIKPKITGVSGGGKVVAQRGHGPCWPWVCPACCYRPSCHHCCCSVAASVIG